MFVVLALVSLFLYRKWVEGPVYDKTNHIDGKVVAVTGCNMGIGKEIALEMAKRGDRVYMACMHFHDCEETRVEIVKLSNNAMYLTANWIWRLLNRFVNLLNNWIQQLDILINNAGIKTKEGYEEHIRDIMDKLKASPSSRIVVVASAGYKLGTIPKDGIHNEKSSFGTSGYFNSNLANVLFTRKLSEILKGTHVTVNCLHPGSVGTNIAGFTGVSRKIAKIVGKLLVRSPRGGAQTSIFLALEPEMEGISGGYYDRMKLKNYSENALDNELVNWLWNESEIMVGLKHRTAKEPGSMN